MVNRDLKDKLAIFKLEEWEIFEQVLGELNIKNQHERLVGRFLRTAARDEIIRVDEVYMGNRLSRWFREVQNISCYEVPIVMYINKNEARGYERVQICIEEKYEKE